MAGPLARSSPVPEFSFRDRESDQQDSAPFDNLLEHSLYTADLASMLFRENGDGKIIKVPEEYAPRYF